MGLERPDVWLVSVFFLGILTRSISRAPSRDLLFKRTKGEWGIDLACLLVQGVGIPLSAIVLSQYVLIAFWPSWQGALRLSPFWAFGLAFFGVDYLYYWNHRLMHRKRLFPLHRLHHSPRHMDVIMTSRNALITPWFMIYFWAHGLFLFLLQDSLPYLYGVALTSGLDLWRHSGWSLPQKLEQVLGGVFITPNQHRFHHCRVGQHRNFGANVNLWDRLHGTFALQKSQGPMGVRSRFDLGAFLLLRSNSKRKLPSSLS